MSYFWQNPLLQQNQRYTVAAGRQILRDGAPFISIGREGDTRPSDADSATREIASLLNTRGSQSARGRHTVEPGRQIFRDDAPFLSVRREGRTPPVDADRVTRRIASLLNANGRRSNPTLVDSIRPGDRVTIVDRFGQTRSGRAVMRSSHGGWVLNMGGRHGTPGIADDSNIVSVRPTKTPGATISWRDR